LEHGGRTIGEVQRCSYDLERYSITRRPFGNVEVGNGSEGWRWVRKMALGAGDAAGYDLWCWARGGMFCELPNGEM